MKTKFYVEIIYEDESSINFNVELEGKRNQMIATICMITRGTLMASTGIKSIAYNEQGFDVCSYIK